jgi:hypothetical protein
MSGSRDPVGAPANLPAGKEAPYCCEGDLSGCLLATYSPSNVVSVSDCFRNAVLSRIPVQNTISSVHFAPGRDLVIIRSAGNLLAVKLRAATLELDTGGEQIKQAPWILSLSHDPPVRRGLPGWPLSCFARQTRESDHTVILPGASPARVPRPAAQERR